MIKDRSRVNGTTTLSKVATPSLDTMISKGTASTPFPTLYTGTPNNVAIFISANPHVIDMAVGVDTEVSYIGPENGNHIFRIRETIALRIKNPKGIAILEERG